MHLRFSYIIFDIFFERQYEHGLITRKQALSSEAILENKEEKQHHNTTCHSQRLALKEPINYKELSTGSNIKLTTGNTAISEHMALFEHKPGDVSVKIMRREKDKFKRGVREAIYTLFFYKHNAYKHN